MSTKVKKSIFLIFIAFALSCIVIACTNANNIIEDDESSKRLQKELIIDGIVDSINLQDEFLQVEAHGGSTKNDIVWNLVQASPVASIDSNGKIKLLNIGKFKIQAVRPGDYLYNDVTAVSQTIQILDESTDTGGNGDGENTIDTEKKEQDELVFNDFDLEYIYGDPGFVIKATGGSVKGNVELSIVGSDSVAIIENNRVKFVGVGTFQIEAFLKGNDEYEDITALSNEIVVLPYTVAVVDIETEDKIYDGNTTVEVSGGKLDKNIKDLDFEIISADTVTVDMGTDIEVNIVVKLIGNEVGLYKLESDIIKSSIDIEAYQLDKPIISHQKDSRVVEWELIEFANGYDIMVNDEHFETLDNQTLSWRLPNEFDTKLTHKISIASIHESNNYIDSDYVTTSITLVQLANPTIEFDKTTRIVSIDAPEYSIVEWSIYNKNFSTNNLDALHDTTTVYARLLPLSIDSVYLESGTSSQLIVFLQEVIDLNYTQTGNTFAIQWNEIDGAEYYQIYINGIIQNDEPQNNYTNITNKDSFSISIVAIGDEFCVSSQSKQFFVDWENLKGDGTIDNPYKINYADDLLQIPSFSSSYFVLTKSISLPDEFESLFYMDSDGFIGYFDGGNNTISNITSPLGLFGIIGNNGIVTNLKLEVNIKSDIAQSVGGLASISKGKISNVDVVGTISTDKANQVGGIVGKLIDGTITQSSNNACIVGDEKVGGIVGQSSNSTIAFSTNHGYIVGNHIVGGLIGSDIDSIIIGNYNNGNIKYLDKANFVGGIVGQVENNTCVVGNYNLGQIIKEKEVEYKNGGIAGANNTKGTIKYNMFFYQNYGIREGIEEDESYNEFYHASTENMIKSSLYKVNNAIKDFDNPNFDIQKPTEDCFNLKTYKLWWEKFNN
ncbi:MAG: hypothetical protein FWF56_03235 [Firmicutes bacterium]|nr:hypothetical protein [Bacillota bacterium]MCL1953356.1 hypothetical protein [Bacillota bacterium]